MTHLPWLQVIKGCTARRGFRNNNKTDSKLVCFLISPCPGNLNVNQGVLLGKTSVVGLKTKQLLLLPLSFNNT